MGDAALIAQGPGLILADTYRVPFPRTVTVATFTDANPNATASDFTATINWGDGTSTSGTVVAQNSGGFAVEGSHAYAVDSRLQLGHPVPLFEIGVDIHDIGGSNARASSTATVIPAVTVAEAIANYQSNPNIAPQVVVDSQANVAANLNALETLAAVNDIVSITLTESALDPISQDYPIIIANSAFPQTITTKLVDALLNGGTTVILGNGAPTFHHPNAILDNTGDTINLGASSFQNFYLNGGEIVGGVLITGPGGILNCPGGPDASLANLLAGVTISGDLTLGPGDSLEVEGGSISGAITVDSSAYLFVSGDYTVENLTLNGGNIDAGDVAFSTPDKLIIFADGLVQGYGAIGEFSLAGLMSLENEGTISSDINGQMLAIGISIANDGFVEATNGGKIDLAGPVTGDGQFLIGQAATLELGGPTAEAVTFEFGGAGGTLYLDKATDFSGTVTRLAQADSIDLADFAFSSHPVITNVTGTGAAGSTTDVTIADGSLTTTLQLLNQYAGEYPIASTAYHLELDHPASPTAGTLFTTVAKPVTLSTLVTFNGANGAEPFGSLIADADGNLFGTTVNGGATYGQGPQQRGYGTVFEIAKTAHGYASTPITLVSFNNANGAAPLALIADADGNLFGTTITGGPYGYEDIPNYDGTVFEIAKTADGYANTPTTLVNFNGANGRNPQGSLIADAHGDLFGTTAAGGEYGYGTVFEIAKTAHGYASTPTTLVSFNIIDGNEPLALIADAHGNLFGTTYSGGAYGPYGYGTVFEIAKTAHGYANTPTTLVNFNDTNGSGPTSLIADAQGDLFGTTAYGGNLKTNAPFGDGTVFEIAKTATGYASTPTTLVSFNGTDGASPFGTLIADAYGNLFGTTFLGGTTAVGGSSGFGTVFEIAKTAHGYANTPTTLVNFNGTDSDLPMSGLIADAHGDLFGTTITNGENPDGTVFEITGSGFVALTINGTTVTAIEGATTGTIPVATFTDANPNAAASDFTATINWGDGSSTAGTIVAQSGGGFAVDGTHTYADEGKYTVSVSITDVGGNTASTTSNANIADAALTASATTVSGTEGLAISGAKVGTFTDANPNAAASDFTATINWGDGSSTAGTIVAQSGGGFAVDGTHTYSDEGKYAISTTIKDVGGSTASTTSNASIADAALSAVAVGGQPETLFQSIPDLSTPPNSTFISDVAGNQQMFDKFTLGSQSLVTSITFDVSNQSIFFPNWLDEPLTLAIDSVGPGGAPGAELFSTTFTPADYDHINFNLSFATALVTYDTHLALNPGTYLITYYNQDGLGAIGFVNGGSDQAFAERLSTGTISPVGESLGFSLNGGVINNAATVSGTEGKAINATVATFTDANPNATASDFTATINWGDGTSTTGTIVAQGTGGFAVDGTHTYVDEAKYNIAVSIKDEGGSTAHGTATATVADADVLTGKGVRLRAHVAQTLKDLVVATFKDSYTGNVASDFTATINWGDGTTSAGVVTDSAGDISVLGTHTYEKSGHDRVTVTLRDDSPGTASATATSKVTIPPVKLRIKPVDGDNVINYAEAHATRGVLITGTAKGLVAGEAIIVTVTDGSFSKSYTAEVGAKGSWVARIPRVDALKLANGTATVTAHVDSVEVFEKVTVDEILPRVVSIVASPSNGDLDAGKKVVLTVEFSEKVRVRGHPLLKLNDGGLAQYAGGSGTKALKFAYTVAAGQNTPDLAVTSLVLAGGATIKDAAGNNAVLVF